MATLVLTAIGGAIGGPVGMALGALAGNAIDHALLAPRRREGLRLSDLKLQTSSYGTPIPKIFGTMRVAGSVIWATELREHRSTEGGGKGRPGVTQYSYSASFAVALSARAIAGVGRIWADGKLLRGAGGDFKSGIGAFRLHTGSEDQGADPLIAAAEGAGAPAHRGIAYAVFEDLALGDFGNRIPSLSFEVIADAEPVTAGGALAELAEGAVTADAAGQPLGGFAAQGSARTVAEVLASIEGGWFAAEDDAFALRRGSGAAEALEDQAHGERAIAAADSVPKAVALAHYDPARDYQIGVQRAVRPGAGWREARIELPAVMDAGAARAAADASLARMELERERRTLALGWEKLAVAPGARVTIAGAPGLWRVDRWTLEGMAVRLECLALAPAPMAGPASGGRVLAAPDAVVGSTILHVFELPPLDDAPAAAPQLAIAAAGTGAGWRRAALLLSLDGGVRWEAIGGTALPAVLGSIVTPPGEASAAIEDWYNQVEVELAHAGMVLGDADTAGLAAGANLAMLGEELIQFAEAEPVGGRRWRLRGLWRGRRGTETAIGTQEAGDRFTLLARGSLAVVPLPPVTLGGEARVLAQGAGDGDEAVEAMAAITGRSVLPPAPVHLCAVRGADFFTQVQWVRRSRIGWRWADGVDAPLGEERESYRVVIAPEGGTERIEETAVPMVTLSGADTEDGCLVTVRQIGALGLSPPATLAIAPMEED
jgi:hypothetical protein